MKQKIIKIEERKDINFKLKFAFNDKLNLFNINPYPIKYKPLEKVPFLKFNSLIDKLSDQTLILSDNQIDKLININIKNKIFNLNINLPDLFDYSLIFKNLKYYLIEINKFLEFILPKQFKLWTLEFELNQLEDSNDFEVYFDLRIQFSSFKNNHGFFNKINFSLNVSEFLFHKIEFGTEIRLIVSFNKKQNYLFNLNKIDTEFLQLSNEININNKTIIIDNLRISPQLFFKDIDSISKTIKDYLKIKNLKVFKELNKDYYCLRIFPQDLEYLRQNIEKLSKMELFLDLLKL